MTMFMSITTMTIQRVASRRARLHTYDQQDSGYVNGNDDDDDDKENVRCGVARQPK